MTIDRTLNPQQHVLMSFVTQPKRQRGSQCDQGQVLLPTMEHFVGLVRHLNTPVLAVRLLESVSQTALPQLRALTETASGTLNMAERYCVFQVVATLRANVQQQIELLSERVMLLGDDAAGVQAIHALLEPHLPEDRHILMTRSNRYSRALHLCLLQEFAEKQHRSDRRFTQAEHLQVMHRHWKSELYSSHYLGPKGVVAHMNSQIEERLCQRLTELFPWAADTHVLIDAFTQYDPSKKEYTHAASAVYVLIITFNGSVAFFKQVANGQVVAHEEPEALSLRFYWEPHTGALSVFCNRRDVRHELAMLFRDVVLAHDGHIERMQIRLFELNGFLTPKILHRLRSECVDGIESINVLQIKVACPFVAPFTLDDPTQRRAVMSKMEITRDRQDRRTLYEIAYDDYGIDDWKAFQIMHVKLHFQIAAQAHRKAHCVSVQIRAPNGLNDNSKTAEERKLVLAQLGRLGVMKEF